MTDERLEQIRARYAAHGQHCHAPECNAWTCTVHELLAELERLRGAAEGLEAWLTYMDSESEGLQFAQCDEKGRELGLWK